MRRHRDPRDLAWSNGWQGARLIVIGATAPVAGRIALVVGTILSLVNQGSAILGGSATGVTWVRVGVNYLVPYIVSSLGYLAPFRVSQSRESERGDRTIDDGSS